MKVSVAMLLREALRLWLPAILSLVVVVVCLLLANWWLLKRRPQLGSEEKLPRQLVMLALTGAGIAVFLLMVPVDDSIRNQLLAILGLIATAIMGLSSTTLVANAMASVMLRTTDSIRTGDFLQVGDHFGRVTERGLLHTEIQTENRDLTTLPNSYLISHPFTVVRSSGTIISTTLSLGYDVSVATVEPLLLEAAQKAGLEEPFVRVMELGNFAITYQISGFLSEIKFLLSSRSKLCRAVIETLHGAGVEIVSPTFMNQRPIAEGVRFIPKPDVSEAKQSVQSPPEEIMFDKAEEAEQIELARTRLQSELKRLERQAETAEDEEQKRIQMDIKEHKRLLSEVDNGDATERDSSS